MNSDRVIPILPSQNLRETVNFYQRLGFEPVSAPDFAEVYAILCRGSWELHFVPIPEIVPSESYAGCYLRISQVDELYQEYRELSLPAEGIPRLGAIADQPWGMREFYIVDPSGNLLRIGRSIVETV